MEQPQLTMKVSLLRVSSRRNSHHRNDMVCLTVPRWSVPVPSRLSGGDAGLLLRNSETENLVENVRLYPLSLSLVDQAYRK